MSAGLQPVVEDLDQPDDGIRGLGEHAVADREREERRLRADRPRLVDEDELRRVHTPGEVGRGARQADADEAGGAVAERARRSHGHHLGRASRTAPPSRGRSSDGEDMLLDPARGRCPGRG